MIIDIKVKKDNKPMRTNSRPRISNIKNRQMNQRNRPIIKPITPVANYTPTADVVRKPDICNVEELLIFNTVNNTQKKRIDKLINELKYDIEIVQRRWLTIVDKITCDFMSEKNIEGRHKKCFPIQDRMAVAIALEKQYRGVICNEPIKS